MAQYIGIDKERYDQGDKFLSQDRYLANYSPRDAINFNESSNTNTGIMGPRINPYPVIPMYGDGGDGGGGITPRGNSKFDYEFEALGGLNNPDNVALTDEERDVLNTQINKDRLAMAGKLGLFALNPVGYFMGKAAKKAGSYIKDKFFSGDTGGDGGFDQDQYDAGKASAAAQAAANRDYARSGGDDSGSSGGSTGGSQESSSPGSTGPGGSDEMGSFEYGGRVGYNRGKLVEGILGLFKPSTRVGFRSRKDIPLEQYSKMEAPITTKMMEEIPESELKKIFRTQELGLYDETPEILKAGNLMQRFTKEVGGKRVIDYEKAEDILNVRLRGDETLDELFQIEFRTRPVERSYGGIVGMYR